jgi:hypothetical protein
MSNDVIDQLRRYLDYAAEESAREQIAATPGVGASTTPWFQRGPILAGIAALLVLAVAVPALLLGSGPRPPADSALPDPLEVGVDYVWPEGGFSGSPEEIAAEFARRALDWTDFETVNSDPEATPDGPVWTMIQHPGSGSLEVLSIPVDGDRRVLMQIGSSGNSAGPNENGPGQWIGISQVAGAHAAYLHVRFVDPDRVEVIEADESDLARGRVDITQDSPIGGVVVVYVNEAGEALTASGAHFGPLDELPDPPAPITYTTYVDGENVWIESDCPNTDQVLKGNPDGLPHISSVLTREEIEARQGLSENSRIIPRYGEVWERTANGEVVVTQVDDYMIEVTLDDIGQCPSAPTSANGVQVIYRIAGD